MRTPNLRRRSTQLERIDGDGLDFGQYRAAFDDIQRVNRFLGGKSALTRHLFPMIEAIPGRSATILDVGTGSADIPAGIAQWARRKKINVDITAVDSEPFALQIAQEVVGPFPEIHLLQADVRLLGFTSASFDFVIASLFLHHFPQEEAGQLLAHLSQIARIAVIVNDLRRDRIPYCFIKSVAGLFSHNEYFRNDAPLSVLRGFRKEDLEEFRHGAGGSGFEIHQHFPYRIVLVIRK